MVAVYNSPQHKILAVNEFDILMLKADRSDMSVSRGYMLRSGCLPTSAWVVTNSFIHMQGALKSLPTQTMNLRISAALILVSSQASLSIQHPALVH